MLKEICTLAIAVTFALTGVLNSQAQTITIKMEPKQPVEAEQPVEVEDAKKMPFEGKRASVDIAILLDTSNSMDGLIDQAKSQLWNIVQEFGGARKAGLTPSLRISVFEYGNSTLPASEGYIRQVVQLTDDLDSVSEAMFSLTTKGGDEYCGMVIGEALTRLDWSDEPNAYKAIFIAGNEPFTQGSVDYRASCKTAIESGVIVNTIHCGDYDAGIAGMWKAGADLAEGDYMNIDQDIKVVAIKTPHDKVILDLNVELNKTYLWYGPQEQRDHLYKNIKVQDRNAVRQGNYSIRIKSKASGIYSNVGRDLVDTLNAIALEKRNKGEALQAIQESELPEVLRDMPAADRLAFIEAKAVERAEIQRKIAEASQLRAEYIHQQQAQQPESLDATFGNSFNMSVRSQLEASGFKIESKPNK